MNRDVAVAVCCCCCCAICSCCTYGCTLRTSQLTSLPPLVPLHLHLQGLYVTEDPGGVDKDAQFGNLSMRMGLGWSKSHSMHTGQCPVMRYHKNLMQVRRRAASRVQQYTVYRVQCTMYSVQCIVYNVQCKVCVAVCTAVCAAVCTLCNSEYVCTGTVCHPS